MTTAATAILASALVGCASVPPVPEPAIDADTQTSAAAVGRVALAKHLLQLAYRLAEGAALWMGLKEVQQEPQK